MVGNGGPSKILPEGSVDGDWLLDFLEHDLIAFAAFTSSFGVAEHHCRQGMPPK